MAELIFMYSVGIYADEMNDLLADFAAQVDKGKYSKMSYQMWRNIKSATSDNYREFWISWRTINEEKLSPSIHLDDGRMIHAFSADDLSFGSYLWDKVLYCEENDWHWTSEYAEYLDRPKETRSYYTYDGIYHEEIAAKAAISKEEAKKHTINVNEDKEKKVMKGFNFEFGPVNPAIIRMSMYGLAIKNKAGTFVSYDAKNGDIMDVDILNFDGAKYIWKAPVAIKDITVGDVIVHQNIPMFVVNIPEGGKTLTAVDPVAGERKEIMLAKSPFGFNFATKVINLLGNMLGGEANADNPFGNMWMLMAMGQEGNGNGSMNFEEMLPMLMFAQGGANMDPTMMMIMMAMSQSKNNEMMLPMMWAMQNMAKPAAVPHVCNCGGNCGQYNQ